MVGRFGAFWIALFAMISLVVLSGGGTAQPLSAGVVGPANDNLGSALEIAFQPYTNVQSTASATTEVGETLAFSDCQGDWLAPTIGTTVWYKYTHSAPDTTLQIDTIASKFDTVVAVYSGPAASPTYGALTYLACGDQEWNTNFSGLTFSAVNGQTYYIQAGGYSGAAGSLALNISPIVSTAGTMFTVNSDDDVGDPTPDGSCSEGPLGTCNFREAIQESNALVGTDVITFSVGGGAVAITPLTPLPAMVNVVIDARTEAAFGASPVVTIDGVSAGCLADALQPSGSPVSIRGFAIVRACFSGVLLTSDNNVVQGNYIGIATNGTTAMANSRGIYLWGLAGNTEGNVIGGTTPAGRNVISGNTSQGIFIDGNTSPAGANRIIGNYIGTNAAGTAAVANGSGIGIAGSAGASGNIIGVTSVNALPSGGGNVISGNSIDGIAIAGANATLTSVAGNYIGLNAAGNATIPNSQAGVRIYLGADMNVIGGSQSLYRNVISGNTGDGISIADGTSTGNSVLGNYIGTDAGGTVDLGNGAGGVAITQSPGNRVGGSVVTPGQAPGNLISGNTHGIAIYGDAADANEVWGNSVGLDATGTADLGNSDVGIWVLGGADDNLIGDAAGDRRNVVSGNARGIAIFDFGTTGNIVRGNFAGTNLSGTAAVGNSSEGVGIGYGASSNTIGGTAFGSGNVLSGNGQNGVRIGEGNPSNSNTVQRNLIGTNNSGTSAVPNGTTGISILGGSSSNTIGQFNVISGNTGNGIQIDDSNNNTISGSRIGTNSAGTVALGNGGDGIAINNSSDTQIGSAAGTTPGGACSGACNLVSGNTGHGLRINGGSQTIARSSFFGLDVNGLADIGNGGDGVRVDNGHSTGVGIDQPGEGNVISGNGGSGVDVRGTAGAGSIAGNLIGTNSAGTADLSNDVDGVRITNSGGLWLIGNASTNARNVISGHGGHYGIYIASPAANNFIQNNRIGTNLAGSAALGNGTGIFIQGSAGNHVGTTTFVGNLISGNDRGVWIQGAGASGNLLVRNFIGTNSTGDAALPNTFEGVFLEGAPGNTVGSTIAGQRNLISGNGGIGVRIDNSGAPNVVQGNYIGTDVTGTADLGNNTNGVALWGSGNIIGGDVGTTPGGACTGACNLISGNNSSGVNIVIGGHIIKGNFIGTNVAGTTALANSGHGIYAQSFFSVIGGASPAARNVISGNFGTGVALAWHNNTVQGNYIGTKTDGIGALGNSQDGVTIWNPVSGNLVGGTGAGEGNVIAYNGGNGVQMYPFNGDPFNNQVRRNSIHSNGLLGIELVGGANGGVLAPTILSFNPPANEVVGETCAFCVVEVFSDSANEGRVYQGTTTADFLGDWVVSAPFVGPNITATTTNGSNTSEFSTPFACPDMGDGDGVCDAGDNCPSVANPTQSNADADAFGDHCDTGDSDGDGYSDQNEARYIGTKANKPCGNDGWPSDLDSQPQSFNELDIFDLVSFVAPVRLLDKNPGPGSPYNPRWDLAPGPNSPFPNWISIFDITTMLSGVAGSPAYPPMFGGARAFGKDCPFPP